MWSLAGRPASCASLPATCGLPAAASRGVPGPGLGVAADPAEVVLQVAVAAAGVVVDGLDALVVALEAVLGVLAEAVELLAELLHQGFQVGDAGAQPVQLVVVVHGVSSARAGRCWPAPRSTARPSRGTGG